MSDAITAPESTLKGWEFALPSGWSSMKLKHVAQIRLSNVDKKTVEGERRIRLCNYVDVYYHDFITPDMEFMEASASAAQIARFGLRRGDVLITKDSEAWDDIAVPACVEEDFEDVICGYHLAHLRPYTTIMYGPFLFRAIGADGVRDHFRFSANGITRYGISLDDISTALIPVPPLPEQRSIAAFLDRKTAQIDAVVAKKQRLIERLQEKRQALISHAVTKGLDPHAPLKDSGVEWLGEIPAHWNVMALKRAARDGYKTFTDGDWIEAPFVVDDGIRLLQTGNVGIGYFKEQGFRYVSEETFKTLRCTEVSPRDVLICRLDGPVGRACLAPNLGVRMITSVDNAILKTSEHNDPRFLVYLLSLTSYLQWVGSLCRVGGGHRLRVSRSMLGDFRFAFPKFSEQKAICDYLDSEAAKLETLTRRLEQQTTKLQEYRQSLISAAVTGKIDVTKEAES